MNALPQTTNNLFLHVPPPAPISLEGNLTQNFRYFKQQWDYYCNATGLDKMPDDVKLPAFYLIIGKDMYQLVQLMKLKDEDKNSVEKLLQILESTFKESEKINVVSQRLQFNCSKQEMHETNQQFLTRLIVKASSCNFGGSTDDMIRDRFLAGIHDTELACQLAEDPKLTLEKIIKYVKIISSSPTSCSASTSSCSIKSDDLVSTPLNCAPKSMDLASTPPCFVQKPPRYVRKSPSYTSKSSGLDSILPSCSPKSTGLASTSSSYTPRSPRCAVKTPISSPTISSHSPQSPKRAAPMNNSTNTSATENIETVNISDADNKGGEEEVCDDESNVNNKEFAVGSFLVITRDPQEKISSDLPIWKIKKPTLLQRYIPFEKNGEIFYRKDTEYLGWVNRFNYFYHPVKVDVALTSTGEYVIKVLNNFQ